METNLAFWFSILEVPFLAICVIFSFLTAKSLRGGAFGRGMTFIDWGFLIMAIGHIHMQSQHYFNFDVFAYLLPSPFDEVAWYIALVCTWALSGFGFYHIYRASK